MLCLSRIIEFGLPNFTEWELIFQDAFASERRKAKMLNFSIAYGKTPVGLSRDWKVTLPNKPNLISDLS